MPDNYVDRSWNYANQGEWDFVCGNMQSPINIEVNKLLKVKKDRKIELKYTDKVENVDDTGNTIQVNIAGEAVIDGRVFSLLQFHFHSRSEHTINSNFSPMEVHFVHKAINGKFAVIGVFFIEGDKNEGFQAVLDNIIKGSKNEHVNEHINLYAMLPENPDYYHYLGSLTIPPLTENVEWYIMEGAVEVSKEQIKEFNKYYFGNYREVQPLNGRVVLHCCHHES